MTAKNKVHEVALALGYDRATELDLHLMDLSGREWRVFIVESFPDDDNAPPAAESPTFMLYNRGDVRNATYDEYRKIMSGY